jgi:hypothetical protein
MKICIDSEEISDKFKKLMKKLLKTTIKLSKCGLKKVRVEVSFVDKKEIDPSELKALTLKIASIRTKNESLEDGNYIILTANMEIFEKEFITYCDGEVINEEKTNSYANLVIE